MITIDNVEDNDFTIEEITVKREDEPEIFKELLIRNQNHKKIKLKEQYKSELESKPKAVNKIIIKKSTVGSSLIIQNFKNIYSEEQCNNMIDIILENELNVNKIEEVYKYLMECIGIEYYEPYPEWIRILWALKSIDPMLYPFF